MQHLRIFIGLVLFVSGAWLNSAYASFSNSGGFASSGFAEPSTVKGEVGVFVAPGASFYDYSTIGLFPWQREESGRPKEPEPFFIATGFYLNIEPRKSRSIPSWHLSFIGATHHAGGKQQYYLVADNSLYWNLIPSNIDFVKFDMGLNIRAGTVFFYINGMIYLDLDFTIPDTGVHFNFATKLGLIADYGNHDVKLSLGYEMDFLPKFKPGVEVGYQLWTKILSIGRHYDFFASNTFYLGFYGKW